MTIQIKGVVQKHEIPARQRGAGVLDPEVVEIMEAVRGVPEGQFLVIGYEDKKMATRRAGALKNHKHAAFVRGTNLYVSRNGAS